MHVSDFDLHSLAIRHLVAVYAVILLVQGGYFVWIARNWLLLTRTAKKSPKPVL